jgi:hypothetical protein
MGKNQIKRSYSASRKYQMHYVYIMLIKFFQGSEIKIITFFKNTFKFLQLGISYPTLERQRSIAAANSTCGLQQLTIDDNKVIKTSMLSVQHLGHSKPNLGSGLWIEV